MNNTAAYNTLFRSTDEPVVVARAYLSQNLKCTCTLIQFHLPNAGHVSSRLNIGALRADRQAHQVVTDAELLRVSRREIVVRQLVMLYYYILETEIRLAIVFDYIVNSCPLMEPIDNHSPSGAVQLGGL